MGMIAVIGAGVMGSDVALAFAAAGHSVVLHDIDAGVLDAARSALPRKLRAYRLLGAELACWDATRIASRIRASTELRDAAAADWVIENVSERWAAKEAVYMALRGICRPDAFFGVNTSCSSVTRIAALMPDPGRVVGAHFMNPVPLKPLVEVARGWRTADETVTALETLLSSLGKRAVVVRDFPGFVANRLSHLFMNEAAFLTQEGVATPAQIDAIFRDGYGHRMGPLQTADLIGLDTVVQSLEVLYQDLQDPKFRCCPLLRRMVEAGDLGCKTKKGFYEYRDESGH